MTPASNSSAVLHGSILFTDLVGFTAYTSAVGDAAAVEALEAQTRLAELVVEPIADARIVKELGDGLMIWIRSPAAALDGSVALLNAIQAAHAAGDFPLPVRMGLHCGDVVARGDDLVGQSVNIASRVASIAGPGELLVSEDVLLAAHRHGHTDGFRAVGPVTVKGVSEPIWLQRFHPAAANEATTVP